jgi:class 3 adenylate cyclase
MNELPTVMFADLTGSTGLFERLGNGAAAQVVTGLTGWIGEVCVRHRGRVVKTLGDGVMAVFADASRAVEAVVQMQREHARWRGGHSAQPLQLRVGLDCGELVEVDGDCFGDAVNVASRLCDLSGARQIWATDRVVERVPRPPPGVRFHALGLVPIRGKAQERRLYRIGWQGILAAGAQGPDGGRFIEG